MIQKLCTLFFVLVYSLIIFSQAIDYTYNWRAPLNIPLVLAGNFGELRSNHFHTGIDIKTNRKTGYNIYAAEEGYVSRIRVSPWGYGHALYVDHPNGMTTVYAHLERFVGEIEALVKTQQKKNEDFAIDYYPAKDSLKVSRGEIIAISGNTGGSSAPHLHFEIRDTQSEEALNPLLFKFDIKDSQAPTIRNMKVYALTKEGYIVPGKSRIYPVTGSNGKYYITNNALTIPASFLSAQGGIGFSFDVIDKLDDANNICGFHKASLQVNPDTVFTQEMERISFFSNRQINTHKDYDEYHLRRRHFHKAFRTKNNTLPIYRSQVNQGIIKPKQGEDNAIEYTVSDSYGNSSKLSFSLRISPGEIVEEQVLYPNQKLLYPDSSFLSYDTNHYILFPPGILYEPTPLIIQSDSNAILFGNDQVPLQETFKLMMPIPNIDFSAQSYIQRIDSKKNKHSESGTSKDGWITSRIRSFGYFSVEIDTLPPRIKARNFIDNGIVNGKRLSWYISEEESGLVDYDVFVDGQWFLLEYEPKQKMFFFDPPQDLKGIKAVTLRAIDAVGNQSEVQYQLTF